MEQKFCQPGEAAQGLPAAMVDYFCRNLINPLGSLTFKASVCYN